MSRKWAMPNKNTFTIQPINDLIVKYINGNSVDMFANNNKFATHTNDLDPQYDTDKNMDALDYLKTLDSEGFDTILFDPPYSPRQVSECYKSMGKTVNMETTQSSFWGNIKKEISRIAKHNSIVMTFGWNSGGVGVKYGFEIVEVLIVAHGGWHNDTIITVEKKVATQAALF